MKQWGVLLILTLLLIACNDEEQPTGPTIKKVTNINEDIQSVIDITEDEKFASVIYSEKAASYLLLNATGEVDVTATPAGDDLILNVEHTKKDGQAIKDIVYEFIVDQPYNKILVHENGKEIPFEVWTE